MNKFNLSIDEAKFFVHFQDNKESVVILNYDEINLKYYRLTHFGADVVGYLLEHPGATFDEIKVHLCSLYESSVEEVKKELLKVLNKLDKYSILS